MLSFPTFPLSSCTLLLIYLFSCTLLLTCPFCGPLFMMDFVNFIPVAFERFDSLGLKGSQRPKVARLFARHAT